MFKRFCCCNGGKYLVSLFCQWVNLGIVVVKLTNLLHDDAIIVKYTENIYV